MEHPLLYTVTGAEIVFLNESQLYFLNQNFIFVLYVMQVSVSDISVP